MHLKVHCSELVVKPFHKHSSKLYVRKAEAAIATLISFLTSCNRHVCLLQLMQKV